MKKRKVRTPTILQMEATECGAAALAIILAHYGRFISLEQMRVDCSVSRDGCSAIHILNAARQHGMIAQAAKVDEINDLSELTFPFIIFWEFNHFVVLEGIEDKIYINDPAVGPRVIDKGQFNRLFTGVIITVTPGPTFTKTGRAPSLVKALLSRLKGAKSDVGFVMLASFSLVFPTLLVLGLTKIFIDNILIENISSWKLPFFTVFFLAIVVVGLLTWIEAYYLLRVRVKFLMVSSMICLWHVISLPINFFQQRFAGDISERVAANDRIANVLSSEICGSIVSFFTMGIYGVVMVFMSWQLAIISFIATLFNLTVYKMISRNYADISRNFLQQNGKLRGLEMYGLYLIEDLKANGRENDFFKRWSGTHAIIISLQQKQAIYAQLLTLIPTWSAVITTTIILGYGSLQIMDGLMTIGSLVAFQLLLNKFNLPIQTLMQFGGEIQKIKGDFARLDDINNHPIDQRLKIAHEANNELNLCASISLKNVSFNYAPLTPMITNINLEVLPGECFAIIGKTGEGKSTIAKLIAGLYQPYSGEIKIGGKLLKEIDAASLAKLLSYVDQDIFLYAGTVKENITLWDENITDEAILKALEDACIADIILERGGLEAMVQENGINFSGGQRQRIEIARALATNPKLVILDEATSNLDADTEKKVLANIKKRGCTTMILTHRLDAIGYCDHIYTLEASVLTLTSKRIADNG